MTGSIQTSSAVGPNLMGRWTVLLILTGGIALAIGWTSKPDRYEDRLVDIVARQELPPSVYRAAGDSAEVKALFLDASARDFDLGAKLYLATIKYGKDANQVLDAYGTDEMFQMNLRRYGEQIVPVVAYFMNNNIATLRIQYGLARYGDAILQKLPGWLRWGEKKESARPREDNPVNRGLHAIEQTAAHGHHFLGQFAIDEHGVAHWNQTDRVLKTVEDLLLGGVRDLETKHRTGEHIELGDIAWATTDVFVFGGSVKVLKALRAVGKASKQVKGPLFIERSKFFGPRILLNERLGKHVLKFVAKAAPFYLVVRHPGLLTSLFREIGERFGVAPWLAATLGWWLVGIALSFILLPLAGALVILVPLIRAIARVAGWLRPRFKAPAPAY